MAEMNDRDEPLQVLTSVPNELQAALIVNTLSEHGILATATGAFVSGFKAEAPGDVRVLVRRSDAEAAGALLRAMTEEKSGMSEGAALPSDDSADPHTEGVPPDLARAWRSAVIGLVLLPPLPHLYSLWLLLGRDLLFSANPTVARQAGAVLALDIAAILVFGLFYLSLFVF